MPQMAPINWLSMFFIFCLTFIMFNLLNYFSIELKNNFNNLNNKKINNKNYYNWKW